MSRNKHSVAPFVTTLAVTLFFAASPAFALSKLEQKCSSQLGKAAASCSLPERA